MVLESLTDNSDKAKPEGMEAPYSDWKMSGEDLVDYQDKDARGLTFVFSVERFSDSEAMRKFVSVYQKPSDDNTGAYVVVSMSPANPNDMRVYEISNTTYGNEPDDPKIFLQKVIEMADESGMLRDISDYGNYGIIETAEDFKSTPVMDGKGGSSGKAPAIYKPKQNNSTPPTVKGSPVAGQQNKPVNNKVKTYGNNSTNNQAGVNKNLSNAGFTTPQQGGLFVAIKNAGQMAANKMGDIYRTYAPESQTGQLVKKTASTVTNGVIANSKGDEAKLNAYAQVHNDTTSSMGNPHKTAGNKFEQPVKNVKDSTTKQMKDKSSDGLSKVEKLKSGEEEKPVVDKKNALPDEIPVKPKSYSNPLVKAATGVAGGVIDALSKTQQGATVGLHPVDDAKRGKIKADKQNISEDKRFTRDSIAAEKVNKDLRKTPVENEQAPLKGEPKNKNKDKKGKNNNLTADELANKVKNHNNTGVWQ